MTHQPVWKLVGTVGDVHPIDYDGGFVYEDTTGVYPPELEWVESDDGGGNVEAGPWTVYRTVLDPPRFRTLTEKGKSLCYGTRELPASERGDTWYWYNEWFVKDLPSLADTCGTTVFSLLRSLFSKNPVRRAQVYVELAQYHGWENFDSYPLKFADRAELEARYEKRNA